MMDESKKRQESATQPAGARRGSQDTASARIRHLEQALAASEATIASLLDGQVDAVIDPQTASPLLLRQTQAALLQSEKKLRAIFANALEAIVIVDDEGVYLDANPAAEALLGAPREQIVGRRVADFLAQEGEFSARWDQFWQQGDDRGHIALRRPDGEIRYAEYSAVANFLPGQNLSVMRDVTERMATEQKRQEALYQLRERVKELTLLHHAGQLFNVRRLAVPDLLQAIVDLIPPAWQYPEITMARLRYGELTVTTESFEETSWVQQATFTVPDGQDGVLEVFYGEERPEEAEGPFLAEERTALDALVSMLNADLERRHATEALQQSEERYRTLFETMAQGVIYQDPTGRVIDINPAAKRMLGLGGVDITTEVITNNDLNLVREDGSPFAPDERPGRKSLRTGQPVLGEVMGLYIPAQGIYHWIVVNSIPQFRPGEDKPYQVYSTLTDITGRKRAEEHRSHLAALVASSQDAIIGVDFDSTITSWNQGAEEIFGYTAEEAVGRPMSIISPPEHKAQQQSVVDRVARGEKVDNYNAVRLTKDGERIFVSFSISPILDSTGRAVGLSGIARDITDQKRAEARLRFQAQLLDSVDEAVVAIDHEDRILYWGKGATALYGHKRDEVLGRTLREANVIPDHITDDDLRKQRETVRKEGVWRGEVQQEHRDGSTRWVRISLTAIRDAQGRPIGYVGIDRDVTARRQHERELEAIAAVAEVIRVAQSPQDIALLTFEQLQNYLDLDSCAVALLQPDGQSYYLAHVSGRYEAYKGDIYSLDRDVTGEVIRNQVMYVSEDVSGDGIELDPPPQDLAALCAPLVASGNSVGAMWLGRREKPFDEAEQRLVTSIADMLAGALQRSFFFDRLQEQAFQVQRVMDSVEDGLLLLDSDGRVKLANPSAVEYLAALGAVDDSPEVDEETVIGRRIERLGPRALQSFLDAPPGTEPLVAVKERSEKGNAPIRGLRREFNIAAHPVVEGSRNEVVAGPNRTPDAAASGGQEQGWVLVLRDVTEARRAHEMEQQQERLAAVGQLAAGIAHDFNNVMSAIVLYAQILQRRDDLNDKERRRLDVIYRQANHAIDLIKQILDFSRRSVMERSAMDLVPFFKEMFRLFEHTLPESIALALHYDASNYIVQADPTRLQQAIMNLAINARDAMPEGGSFSVHLLRKDLSPDETPPLPDMAPGPWLQIVVADDGSGMSEEMVQHVFEPFYTTKEPGKGTGLGLAQVYGIIHQHDGAITVDSMRGQGTTFTIYLPLIEKESDPADTPSPTFAQATPAPRDATILLVEDEGWARVAVEESLQALGYHVLSAGNGREALQIFDRQEQNVDLVLSDMVMPEMGGLVLYEIIRARRPQMKMVIMSGYPLEDEGRSLLEQGVVAWIAKPFSVNELAQKIAQLLEET